MRITTKGQVTIPQHIRDRLGLTPSTEVEFDIVGNFARIRKVPGRKGRGASLVAHMRGKASGKMTTDEILRLTRT